jgi:mono/diheme cytochrome c family protein
MNGKILVIGAALAASPLFGPAYADPGADPAADPAVDQATLERGQAHYLLFCANCHGVNGDGNGPLVGLLKVTPSNLTVLRRQGPPSVTERVLNAVDGRHQVTSGEHKMPIFSDNLEVRTVREIALYLDSIQQ